MLIYLYNNCEYNYHNLYNINLFRPNNLYIFFNKIFNYLFNKIRNKLNTIVQNIDFFFYYR